MMSSFTKDKSIAQLAAFAIGAAYLSGGVIGLILTGFSGFVSSTGTELFGLFTINPFHSVVHIGVAAILILAATRDTSITEGALIGVGGIYVVATITGFIYAHIPVIALTSSTDPDNYLHLVTGTTAILAAVVSASQTGRSRRLAA
jgi:hypothetical protein